MKSFKVAPVLTVIACFTLGLSHVAQAQPSPRIGTWKLNLAKSTYDPGPPPTSDTRTYEGTGDGEKATIEQVAADGTHTTNTFTAKLDGPDVPITGNPNADTVALKRINASTIEATLKKGGKVVLTTTSVVSKDGKVMTQTAKGTNASGQPVNNRLVFDKQ